MTHQEIVAVIGAANLYTSAALDILGVSAYDPYGILGDAISDIFNVYGADGEDPLDYKVYTYRRLKKKYRVNLLTGERTLMETCVQTKAVLSTRENGTFLPYDYHSTVYDEDIMQ